MRGTWHRRVDPIFVDRTGRRRRVVTMVGAALGVALTASLGLLVAGLFGASPVHVPGFATTGVNAEQVKAGHSPGADGRSSPTPEPSSRVAPTASIPDPAATSTVAPTASPTKRHPASPDHPHPTKSR